MKNVKNLCYWTVFLGTVLLSGCQEGAAQNTAGPAGQAAQVQEQAPSIQVAEPSSAAASQDSPKPQPTQPAVKGPKIRVTKDTHDFGEIGPGSSHVCEYTFQNVGTETLVIERIQSTCGCSVPRLDKKEYAPGEKGTIEVRFHAPTSKGTTTKHLYILSNDPETPRAQLELRATVSVKVTIEPEEMSLMLNQPNAGLSPITIKSTDGKKFAITKFTSTNNAISCEFDPTQKATEFTLKPVADPNRLAQFPNGVMQIEVDHPQGGTLLVRYAALPRYEVNRPRIILQNARPGQTEQKEVIIKSNYGDTLEIAEVSSRLGYMKIVDQKAVENALKLTIEITMPQKDSVVRRYFSDELKITFENGQDVAIRVSGWFRN